MIFYRSRTATATRGGPSIYAIRRLTVVALAAYPAGALTRLLAPETSTGDTVAFLLGFGLILLSLAAAAPVVGSRLQRIVGEQATELDEMEMMLRHRALSWSYGLLSAALLLMLVYSGIATDAGAWMPDSYEEWNGLFWGAFLYVILLPTARLAWTMDATEEEEA